MNKDKNFVKSDKSCINYRVYTDESMLDDIQRLVTKDLSEPYSIFTYRYFLHKWPQLCICVYDSMFPKEGKHDGLESKEEEKEEMIGTIVCKAEYEDGAYVGYIAMLAVKDSYRGQGIGSNLVKKGIDAMIIDGCTEVTLETEVSNTNALKLYDRLGFMRLERFEKYYLNGGDAYRLKLYLDEVTNVLKIRANSNQSNSFSNNSSNVTISDKLVQNIPSTEEGKVVAQDSEDSDVYFKVNTRHVISAKDLYFGVASS